MKLQLQDLPDREFETVHASILRLLSEYGVLFENERARSLLKSAGNSIDSQGRLHLKPKFVESMLELAPKQGFTLYGRDESKKVQVAVDRMHARPSVGIPFVWDYATGRLRDATLEDSQQMATLVDALDSFDMVNSVVVPRGIPEGQGTVQLFVNVHRHSLKPSDIPVTNSREVNHIARVAATIRGGRQELRAKPLTVVDISMISPLRCAEAQADALLAAARWGLPIEVVAPPSMGLTAPITLAGSAVLALAEVVAALCLVYLAAPGLGIINTTRISPTNMVTGSCNYGGPELGMASALTAACAARYGIPTDAYGLGTAARMPGAQAAMEKTSSGLLMALGHPYMVTGGGSLNNALATSPEQLVIDHEIIRFIKRIRETIQIDEEAIGIEVLTEAMCSQGHLMGEEHTVRHFRAGEMLNCSLGQWDLQNEWEAAGYPDLAERSHGKVLEILSSHRVPAFEAQMAAEIESIVDEYC